MKSGCLPALFSVLLGVVLAAPNPSVFQRNGLQREQEGALHREPFEPLSPFQIAHTNVPAGGNIIVVPPTMSVDSTLPKSAPVPDIYQSTGSNRNYNFGNHFEVLNKDALVGLLIEKDIPFYVKTVIEPQKPAQTKIHVMRIPKKYEKTTPLPDVNLNMVEIVNMNATKENDQEAYEADSVKQVESLVAASSKISNTDVIVKVTDRRPEDMSQEQEPPILTVSDAVQGTPNTQNTKEDSLLQGDDPNVVVPTSDPITTTGVPLHAVIYTPEKRPDSKTIWESFGSAFDKAKEKTSDLLVKAKDQTVKAYEKAKETAKDVLDSKESKSHEIVNPADDI